MASGATGRQWVVDQTRALALLAGWAAYSELDWHEIPGQNGLGCYGTGYASWGVQTNQKYVGAMAVLAARGGPGVDQEKARRRALAALRFSMQSHRSGKGACTDGQKWGHGWISVLGIERMMHGVHLLEPYLTDEDRAGLKSMITGEAQWLLANYPIVAGVWNSTKQNKPESNLWNGALLWRAGAMYPDHPQAGEWQEKGVRFLINAVSVAEDAANETVVDGKPVKERHVGANFFPNYALDHHSYLNVGYMVICASNAGILHFDLKRQGLKSPEALNHHQADLWRVIRKMIFADGRLARIGGDTRVRYAYCQEYLMTALMYAQEVLGEESAGELCDGMLKMMETEAQYSEDGSFYGRRLAWLREQNVYYHTRLESDRASVLGFALAHPVERKVSQKKESGFEASVASVWTEPEHGAGLARNPQRLASFSWRAYGLMQGMCQPGSDGHLTDWACNMAGFVEPASHGKQGTPGTVRGVLGAGMWGFEGGFATIGAVAEGLNGMLAEGWTPPAQVRHALAYVALADGRSVVGLQLCRAPGYRLLVRRASGMGMALVNDLYNGFSRTLRHAGGEIRLAAPADATRVVPLGSRFVDVEGKVGLVVLTKGDTFSVMRNVERQAGAFKSLYVERIGVQSFDGCRWFNAGEPVLDTAWAAVSGASREELGRFVEGAQYSQVRGANGRVACVRGMDGKEHVVEAEFGEKELRVVYRVDGRTVVDQAVGVAERAEQAGH